ncbi:MAG: hypothetical protein IPG90_16135 [Bacteroidetes bacterium]|jgi:hypothetical protein|nr:hypothetical protein [Bacteroidota bacterium]MBP6402690.1 hypothetical protein [Bacteroidia bacterium]MBK6839594.1 hypothetical protein [Bacteroidota bacterium]MBK9524527.1 hypothetical protein [Bacteroidota bacterium]MBK9542113.1 hypothetical protein [Bacteroidota bacterium]
MKNYLIQFGIFAGVIALVLFLTGNFIFPGKVDGTSWAIYFYFVILTVLFHVGLLRSAKGRPQVFVRYYIGTTTLKLMLHLGILVLYVLFNKPDAMHFIVTFMIFYFLFTTFEVVLVWKKFRTPE